MSMHLCELKTTDELTLLLFCDIEIDQGMTLNLLHNACVLFVDVEPYRLLVTVLRHHCMVGGIAAHVAIITIII